MLSVRLDSELESLLDRLSKTKGLSKSAIIKDALALYAKREREAASPYELGADLFGVPGGTSEASSKYKAILNQKLGAKHSH